jgi:hypothetical protein
MVSFAGKFNLHKINCVNSPRGRGNRHRRSLHVAGHGAGLPGVLRHARHARAADGPIEAPPPAVRRADRILAGLDAPRSRGRLTYLVLASARVAALIVTGTLLLGT